MKLGGRDDALSGSLTFPRRRPLDPGPVTLEVQLISRSDGVFELEDKNSHLVGSLGKIIHMGPCAVVQHGIVAPTTLTVTIDTTPPAPPVARILPVPPVGPSPITPDCRFLFVVDTSSAMQRQADGLYRTTHRLIANGLGGRMQDGDIFTVWTYADTVLTREFPLNAWTPDLNIALANRAYEFLAKQKFRGKSNLRPVFAELGQALAIAIRTLLPMSALPAMPSEDRLLAVLALTAPPNP